MIEQVLDELKQIHARTAVLINNVEAYVAGDTRSLPQTFGIVTKDGGTVPVEQVWIDEWCKFYPQGFVLSKIRDLARWSVDNPHKRKLKKNTRKWLGARIADDAKKENFTVSVNDSLDKYERRY